MSNPRILVVTPEITYLPQGMGNMATGLGRQHVGHVAHALRQVRDLRRMFHIDVARLINEELRVYKNKLPNSRIHLAEDRVFYYRDEIYGDSRGENPKIALAFQREVINNIIPMVKPDLIHCNDWMTGLIPGAARRLGIPTLFTVHNIHTQEIPLSWIEDSGIDAAEFWLNLYYKYPPANYETTRSQNAVDLLASGVFASHFINTVSPTFLKEIVGGQHNVVPGNIRWEVQQKFNSGCAFGVLNSPSPEYSPGTDPALPHRYGPDNHVKAKQLNKLIFQKRLGLRRNAEAPIFFWPSRLDPIQKGPQLLSDILYQIISAYWDEELQVAIVANGAYKQIFRDIVRHHDFYDRVAVCDFDEELSHLGYAAADYMLMPSSFEPCGLPQMISCIYGTLPVVHDTGGLHDTVEHLDLARGSGNGFVFNVFDSNGLRSAVD